MTKTVDEGFRYLLSTLTPTDFESEAAKNHRASIKACLESNFDLISFFRSGSFGNGTSISGYSDVDYFAWISYKEIPSDSASFLSSVRSALDTRFPRTGVRISCPSVKVPFGSEAKESTEIVPAGYDQTIESGGDTYYIYKIPDCSGGWQSSSPQIHALYVRVADGKLKGKVKPLIRFVKAWKYFNNVPISSFYLELRITKFVEDMNLIVYDIDLNSFFNHLSNIKLAAIQDPMKISGYVYPCSTESQLEETKSKLLTAKIRANFAREASSEGDIKSAFYWWNLIFNNKFPSYY